MLDSAALEVLIGLATIFFVLSIVCTAIVEGLASSLALRGHNLRRALRRLLNDDGAKEDGPLFEAVTSDRRYVCLTRRKGRPPSYLPPETFSEIVVDSLARSNDHASTPDETMRQLAERVRIGANGIGTGETRITLPTVGGGEARTVDITVIRGYLIEAIRRGGDDPEAQLAEFRRLIEAWFNRTMERSIGWYRRIAGTYSFLVALAIVLLANVDAIAISQHLAKNPERRAAIVALGDEIRQASPTADSTDDARDRRDPVSPQVDLRTADPSDAGPNRESAAERSNADERSDSERRDSAAALIDRLAETDLPLGHSGWPKWTSLPLSVWIGWAISVFAITLGAPFWFSVLQKLASIRGAGVREETHSPSPPKADGDRLGTDRGQPGPGSAGDAGPSETPTPTGSPSALPEAIWTLRSLRCAASPQECVARRLEAVTDLAVIDHDGEPAPVTRDLVRAAVGAAHLAAIAYGDRGRQLQRLAADGFPPEALADGYRMIDERGTQAFALRHADVLFVAFRGTEPNRIEDIVTDLRAMPTAGDRLGVDGRVHTGFLEALRDALDRLDRAVDDLGRGAKRLVITGHSLGGALAILYSAHLARRSSLGATQDRAPTTASILAFTFGAPRVGDAEFAAQLTGSGLQVCRFVRSNDPVPLLPPMVSTYADGHGHYELGPRGMRWVSPVAGIYRTLAAAVDLTNDPRGTIRRRIGDHAIDRYIAALADEE